jgi:4-hydroxybenzoate polyprenyltransferase
MNGKSKADELIQYERLWSRGNKFFSILATTHPTAVIVFSGSVLILAIIVGAGLPEIGIIISMILAMAFAQATIGIVNDIYDRDLDKTTKPWRAIPQGFINLKAALVVAIIFSIAALFFSSLVSLLSLALFSIGLGAGVLYSSHFKRTPFSWIPYVFTYPALPIWVWVSLDNYEPKILIFYFVALPISIAIHLCNQLRDFDEDNEFGVTGLTQQLGKGNATKLCFGLMIFAPFLLFLSSSFWADPGNLVLIVFAILFHWILLVPSILGSLNCPNSKVFLSIFKRIQLSGPLMMFAWLIGI